MVRKCLNHPCGKRKQAKCQCSSDTAVFRDAKIPEVSCYLSLSGNDSLLSVILLNIPSHIKPSYRLGKLNWAGQVECDFFSPRLIRQKQSTSQEQREMGHTKEALRILGPT